MAISISLNLNILFLSHIGGGGLVAKFCPACNLMDCRLLCPWDSPGKNTGVGTREAQHQLHFKCSVGTCGQWPLQWLAPLLQKVILHRHWVRPQMKGVLKSETGGCKASNTRCYCLVSKLCPTLLQTCVLQPTRFFCQWDFPGKKNGTSCHFLLQGIFPTQGSNLCLLHWQVNSFPLSHQRSSCYILSYPKIPLFSINRTHLHGICGSQP